ncbi:MAG: hypothetical protein V4506_18540 [Bacteroidota bacterium]
MSLSNTASFKNFSLIKHNTRFYQIDVFSNSEFGFAELRQLIGTQREMGGHCLPVLVLCGEYTTSDVGFMRHLSRNGTDPYSRADAFVIQSISQKLMANFYVKIFTPERPTKFFTCKDEALEWLEQYM